MKEKNNPIKPAVCPRCGKTYAARPAISRTDPSMLICPDCGIREALESMGVGADDQEKIIQTIYQHQV